MTDAGPSRGPRHGDPLIESTGFRLSWGGIFAGLIVALVLQILLSTLGLAIGFSSWEPGTGLGALDTGAWIWAVVSALIALFVGGMVTGRLSGVLTRGDGALHGFIMWGLSVIVGFWMVASGLGMVLGGVFDVVGSTASAAVSGVSSVGAQAVGQVDLSEVDVESLQSEIEQILRESDVPALQPDSLRSAAQAAGDTALSGDANREAASEIARMIEQRAGQVDRDAVLNVVTSRTGMSRAEAERVVTRVESASESATQQASSALDQAQEQATDVAGDVVDAAGTAAWWLLVWMILSAAAAAAGAAMRARS